MKTPGNPLIKKMDQMDLVNALWWFIHERSGFEEGSVVEAVLYLKKRVTEYRRDRNEAFEQ